MYCFKRNFLSLCLLLCRFHRRRRLADQPLNQTPNQTLGRILNQPPNQTLGRRPAAIASRARRLSVRTGVLTGMVAGATLLAGCQRSISQPYNQPPGTSNAPNVLNTAEVYDPNDLIIVSPKNILPGNSTLIQVAENSTEVIQVRAQDTPGSKLIYRLQNGEDIDKFEIDETTGDLRFKTPPDWENPGDANGDNNYMVLWQVVSSTGDVRNQFMIVKVTDVKD